MLVDVNELKRVKDYLDKINQADIQDITWVENGVECVIPQRDDTLTLWRYAGLNNTDFVFTDCYKHGMGGDKEDVE